MTVCAILFQIMKLVQGIFKKGVTKKRRRILADYYQDGINSYGKQQMKSLVDKGLSIQW